MESATSVYIVKGTPAATLVALAAAHSDRSIVITDGPAPGGVKRTSPTILLGRNNFCMDQPLAIVR